MTKWSDLTSEVLFDRSQFLTVCVLQRQFPRLRRQCEIILINCLPMQSDVTAEASLRLTYPSSCSALFLLDTLAYGEPVLLRQA